MISFMLTMPPHPQKFIKNSVSKNIIKSRFYCKGRRDQDQITAEITNSQQRSQLSLLKKHIQNKQSKNFQTDRQTLKYHLSFTCEFNNCHLQFCQLVWSNQVLRGLITNFVVEPNQLDCLSVQGAVHVHTQRYQIFIFQFHPKSNLFHVIPAVLS